MKEGSINDNGEGRIASLRGHLTLNMHINVRPALWNGLGYRKLLKSFIERGLGVVGL